MDNLFKYALSLHIIFIVTWFAGLFYIVRLFIYHTEAEVKPEPEKSILQSQFKIMEKRLWYGITWPSMILTLICGPWVMSYNFAYYITSAYFVLKLCFVGALVLYHIQCHVMFKQLQNDVIKHSSFKLRLWNEVATVLLFAIVFLIVLKSNSGFVFGMIGLIVFSGTLILAIQIYKKSRGKNSKESGDGSSEWREGSEEKKEGNNLNN